ncbi:MAG: dUTP diphosphatase [Candidatus Nanopelagicales bacterium]
MISRNYCNEALVNNLEIKFVALYPDVEAPHYQQIGDAGADLRSRVSGEIPPLTRVLVPTGLAIEIPPGYVGLVHPRSGLAIKSGIGMVNAPGTIDSGYRGEVQVILFNFDTTETFSYKKGDRIAQLVIQKVEVATFRQVNELSHSERGHDGFGSSGLS